MRKRDKRPVRQLRPVLHIFCEGSKTEQITTARRYAEKLNERTINAADKSWTVPSMWNPYTDLYKLLDAIDAFA